MVSTRVHPSPLKPQPPKESSGLGSALRALSPVLTSLEVATQYLFGKQDLWGTEGNSSRDTSGNSSIASKRSSGRDDLSTDNQSGL